MGHWVAMLTLLPAKCDVEQVPSTFWASSVTRRLNQIISKGTSTWEAEKKGK